MPQLMCEYCGCALTRPCAWGTTAQYDPQAQDRQPAVPAGFLIRIAKGDGLSDQPFYLSSEAIAANPEDVVRDSVISSGTDNGCCGSDGLDGPNRSCVCGLVIGVEWSDCWTQAEVRFQPGAVAVLDA